MRSPRLLALTVPAVFVALAACGDSGSSSSSTADAGAEAGIDASSDRDDGAKPSPDAGAKGVTVTVVDGIIPVANLRVLGHDAMGAIIADVWTGKDGKASIAAPPSMVTVLDSLLAVTYLGVTDGDSLVVARPARPETGEAVGRYDVSIPISVPANEFMTSVAGDGCGVGTSTSPFFDTVTARVYLYPSCLSASNTVLVTASHYGQGGYGPERWFDFRKNVPTPAPGATLEVGPMNLATGGVASLVATLPEGTTGNTRFRSIVGVHTFVADDATSAAGGANPAYHVAAGFADAYQSLYMAKKSASKPDIAKGFFRREAAPATTDAVLTYDFAESLPFITAVVVDEAIERVTITSESALAATDGGLVDLVWQDGRWRFVVPAGTQTFTVPDLPPDEKPHVPAAPGTFVGSTMFLEASQLAGYAQLKALAIPEMGDLPIAGNIRKALPSNGTVKITSFGSSSLLLP